MIRRTALPVALALATSLSAPLTAQGPLPGTTFLPTHRVAEVGQAMSAFQIGRAIQSALNSTGDKITLELEASASAALIALVNAGGAARFQVEVARIDGGYEASILQDVAQTCGVEVYEGLEVNARTGFERKVVLFWPDVATTSRGIEALSMAYGLRLVDTIPPAWRRYLDHRQLLDQAVSAIQDVNRQLHAARHLESARRAARSETYAAIGTAQRALNSAYSEYQRARAAVRAAQRAIDESPLPNWMKGALRAALQAAIDVANEAADAYNVARDRLDDARNAYNRFDGLWRDAVSAVNRLEALIDSLELTRQARRDSTDEAYSVWEGLDGLREILATHVRAAQFKVYRGTDL